VGHSLVPALVLGDFTAFAGVEMGLAGFALHELAGAGFPKSLGYSFIGLLHRFECVNGYSAARRVSKRVLRWTLNSYRYAQLCR